MSKQIEYGGTTLRRLLDAALASDCEFETRPTQTPPKLNIVSQMMALLGNSKAPYWSHL
jgi:hypothetical protein